jgi:hypothetical protein
MEFSPFGRWGDVRLAGGREISRGISPATIPARGESMPNLTNVIRQLRKERDQARKKIEQLDEALKALTGVGVVNKKIGHRQTSGRRRTMSAAARKRIAAAQRARWAKWKAAQKKK